MIAYRLALDVRTRDRSPQYWASTQNNLGRALTILGERTSKIGVIDEAATALRGALEIRAEQGSPTDRVMTLVNLGDALLARGLLARDVPSLEEAETCYRAAWAQHENSGAGNDAFFSEKLAEARRAIQGLSSAE